jgi:hypothetical protein
MKNVINFNIYMDKIFAFGIGFGKRTIHGIKNIINNIYYN